MPTIHYKYEYTRHEARPGEFDFVLSETVPGTDISHSVWLTILDPNETSAPF